MGETDVIVGPLVSRYTNVMAVVLMLAALVAMISTGFCAGGVAGAVYRPPGVIVPTVELLAPWFATDQITALLERPLTWAANCIDPPTTTIGTPRGVIVMLCAYEIPAGKTRKPARKAIGSEAAFMSPRTRKLAQSI